LIKLVEHLDIARTLAWPWMSSDSKTITASWYTRTQFSRSPSFSLNNAP
jgi:hypothetical protein